jgi:benzylsuccinate CoA-transferase BbsF subunit
MTVASAEEWDALQQLMGAPEWSKRPEFATAAARTANHDALDAHLGEWTRQHDDYALFHALQAAGIAAAPVLAAWRVLDDPHVIARQLYQPQVLEDDIGLYWYPRPLYELPESLPSYRRAPAAFGQDNDYVYRQLLGVSDAEFEHLVLEGHIAHDFDDAIP